MLGNQGKGGCPFPSADDSVLHSDHLQIRQYYMDPMPVGFHDHQTNSHTDHKIQTQPLLLIL